MYPEKPCIVSAPVHIYNAQTNTMQHKSMVKSLLKASPGQLIALQTFNLLKEKLSGYAKFWFLPKRTTEAVPYYLLVNLTHQWSGELGHDLAQIIVPSSSSTAVRSLPASFSTVT